MPLFLLACPLALAATENWIVSWSSSQQVPEAENLLPSSAFPDATIRQVVHLSAGGSKVRVHLSNDFGTQSLTFTDIHIAKAVSPSTSDIDSTTDHPVRFNGRTSVVIPPGASYVSDAVDWQVAAQSDLAISFYLANAPSQQSGHPGSRATSYYVHGNHAISATLTSPNKVAHWYQLSAVDVLSTTGAAALVVVGDSITDGRGATTDGNNRWTDVLASRLQTAFASRPIGVANQGVGGNHLLIDGLGPSVLARFDRDVLSRAGAKWVIVFEGVNDLGGVAGAGISEALHTAKVAQITGALKQVAARARAQGLKVYGATITPWLGCTAYSPSARAEQDRTQVNEWIRTSGAFDAVLDFDQVVRDPARAGYLLADYDSGDKLHLTPAGYKALGNAVPLTLFE